MDFPRLFPRVLVRFLIAAAGFLAVTFAARAQTEIAPGESRLGEITDAVRAESYTITLGVNDTVVLRAGELAGSALFTPFIQLYGPTGALVASNSDPVDAYVGFRTSVAGKFQVVVSSYEPRQTGRFELHYVRAPALNATLLGDEGGWLTNGGHHDGALTRGDLDAWRIEAVQGDSLILRVAKLAGTAGLHLSMQLYDPLGELVATEGNGVDLYLNWRARTPGLYTVVVSSHFRGDTGNYRLHALLLPHTPVVPDDDEGGPLRSGELHAGVLPPGDLDAWTITAAQGDTLAFRAGAPEAADGFALSMQLYDPSGAPIGTAGESTDVYLSRRALVAGTYTVVLSSAFRGTRGRYHLHALKLPGASVVLADDEGGALVSGDTHAGVITRGDLDAWTFKAAAGDTLLLRAGAVSGSKTFSLSLQLYDPAGAQVVNQGESNDLYLNHRALSDGVYTAVVSSYYRGDTGAYRLHALQLPRTFVTPADDQGGALVSGHGHAGEITVGDLDAWTIQAAPGETLLVRAGKTGGADTFAVSLQCFDPTGVLVAEDSHATDAYLNIPALKPGLHTFVVSSYYRGDAGSYRLHAQKLPGPTAPSDGDEGGSLSWGVRHAGRITVGDLDAWTFAAAPDETVILRAGRAAREERLSPTMLVYGPDGALLANDHDTAAAALVVRIQKAGTHTVIVAGYERGAAGAYRFHALKIPASPDAARDEAGGPLTSGAAHEGALTPGDFAAWTLRLEPGERLRARVGRVAGDEGFSPALTLYDPAGGRVAADTEPRADLDVRANVAGVYTVIVAARARADAGSYRLHALKLPGEIPVPKADEGGPLEPAIAQAATLTPGDLDAWSVTAAKDEPIELRLERRADVAAFQATVTLYDPRGEAVARTVTSVNSPVAVLLGRAALAGRYTAVVASDNAETAGAYELRLEANAANPPATNPPGSSPRPTAAPPPTDGPPPLRIERR